MKQEMDHCRTQLAQTASHWKELSLPYKISTDDADRDEYEYGEFCMTMDQDKIIELLTGKDIYPDPGVFVRELLQNSIDAVLMRVKQDPTFRLEDGHISIEIWPTGAGDTWFRIRDNGTGMDQHIITNYFLKVGRSYYTSEEFRAANRRAPDGEYTAISRFGIGILSCFMADQENTELKVSTKRFGCDEENGIRLDVTGLHGYYYLAHEQKHPDCGVSFLKMPVMDDNDESWGYRTEPGTTICVRTNLFRMGGALSFVEILDKYVQFPEVRVTYDGPDGHRDYPTQQELMAAVEALNPGGDVKEYVHPFPAELAQKIKEHFHIFQWAEDPALVLRYYPVNRLSDSEDMTGVAVAVELRYPSAVRAGMVDPADAKEIRLKWRVSFEQKLSVWAHLASNGRQIDKRYTEMVYGWKQYIFPVAGGGSILSPPEQKVWELLRASLSAVKAKNGHISYHGVLAAEQDPFEEYEEKLCSVLLLRNRFLPDVNVARNQIRRLSPEAACCHAMAVRRLGTFSKATDLLGTGSVRLLTQRQLWAVLEQYPRWQEMLKKQQASGNAVQYTDKLMEGMQLCSVKHDHAVRFDFDGGYAFFEISAAPADADTVDFPVGMFALPLKADCDTLARLRWRGGVYNRQHVFSRWLVGNRAALQKKVPAVYDTMIWALLFSEDGKMICDTVNTILTRLRSFDGNCFGIRDDLFLKESDFT